MSRIRLANAAEFSGEFADGWYIISTSDGSAHTATAVRSGILAPFRTFATRGEALAFVAGFKRGMTDLGRPNLGDTPTESETP